MKFLEALRLGDIVLKKDTIQLLTPADLLNLPLRRTRAGGAPFFFPFFIYTLCTL